MIVTQVNYVKLITDYQEKVNVIDESHWSILRLMVEKPATSPLYKL